MEPSRKQPSRKAREGKQYVDDVELPPLPKKEKVKTGDFFIDTGRVIDPLDDNAVEDAAEVSDYTKKLSVKRKNAPTKKKSSPVKKRRITREPSPEPPDMSDLDVEEERDQEREEDLRLFETRETALAAPVKATVLPKVLRLEVRTAPTIININLADIIPKHYMRQVTSTADDLDGPTLLENDAEMTQVGPPQDFTEMRLNPNHACFLELEPELRNRIYRDVLVNNTVAKFNPAPRLSRTAALLRVSRQVYEEGRGILYGENAFHFDRTDKPRGNMWDEEWKEVGYKDIRRFLETIGQDNISKMRFLSLHLSDADKVFTPKLDPDERRYCNDPVLLHVLKLIGRSGAVFEKLVIGFAGRAEIASTEVLFLRAFTTMKCRKLLKSCVWGHSRVAPLLFPDMKKFMEVEGLPQVDEDRQRAPKMEHQGSLRRCTVYRCADW